MIQCTFFHLSILLFEILTCFWQADRHIRLLDQSIKEQEASIALGVRAGTHLAPILLPELIVPGSRAARVAYSPPPVPAPVEEGDGMTLGMVGGDEGGEEEVHPQRRGRAGKKGRGRLKGQDTIVVPEAEQTEGHNRSRNRNRNRGGGTVRSLKLNGPGPEDQPVLPPPAPDEERYCYCNQVSFGEVRCGPCSTSQSKLRTGFHRWSHATMTIVNVNG
jgi:hypothetical protein